MMGYELRQLTINSKLNWNPDVKFLMKVNLILIMAVADFSLIFFLSSFELAKQEHDSFHFFSHFFNNLQPVKENLLN